MFSLSLAEVRKCKNVDIFEKTESLGIKRIFAKPQQGVAKGLALGGMMDELANDKMAFFRLAPITHSLLCGHLSNPIHLWFQLGNSKPMMR